MTQTLTNIASRSVGELAASHPGATAIFRELGIDFCCGGSQRITDAAASSGVELDVLIDRLAALNPSSLSTDGDRTTPELIQYILDRYHSAAREQLVELVRLAYKVERVHASHPAAPHGLATLLSETNDELESHMQKEEQILFPAMQSDNSTMLYGPIAMMREEHDDHGIAIQELRRLTNDFTPPAGACHSWQALYTLAARFVDDLMTHIHLENNVLFPRFDQKRRVD